MNFAAIKALKDNYMFILYNDEEAISIDPLDSSVILEALSRDLTQEYYECIEELKLEEKCPKRRLLYNLTTHSHLDHSGGNKDLAEFSPGTVFVSGFEEDWCKDSNSNNKVCKDGDMIKERNFEIKCIHTPCHTKDSFCFLVNTGNKHYLVTGDTIFFLGCGLFFEGNGDHMAKCLKKIVEMVPNEAIVLYGHDYNVSDLKFTKTCCVKVTKVEIPEEVEDKRFLTFEEEKKYNPFIFAAMGRNPSNMIQKFRDTKNRFDVGLNWKTPEYDDD
eukprot:jgi/Antlo1/1930/577